MSRTSSKVTSEYQLSDRYGDGAGTVFMTGIQALARLPIEQLRADRAVGLNTAAFASGYQGSPLSGLDQEFVRAARTCPAAHVRRPAQRQRGARRDGGHGQPTRPGSTRRHPRRRPRHLVRQGAGSRPRRRRHPPRRLRRRGASRRCDRHRRRRPRCQEFDRPVELGSGADGPPSARVLPGRRARGARSRTPRHRDEPADRALDLDEDRRRRRRRLRHGRHQPRASAHRRAGHAHRRGARIPPARCSLAAAAQHGDRARHPNDRASNEPAATPPRTD